MITVRELTSPGGVIQRLNQQIGPGVGGPHASYFQVCLTGT